MDDRVSLRHDSGGCAIPIEGEIELVARLHHVNFRKIFPALATKIWHTWVSILTCDLNIEVESLFGCEGNVEHIVEEPRLFILRKEMIPCVAGDNLVNRMTLANYVWTCAEIYGATHPKFRNVVCQVDINKNHI